MVAIIRDALSGTKLIPANEKKKKNCNKEIVKGHAPNIYMSYTILYQSNIIYICVCVLRIGPT